ncbi:MAG TPA: helix-turn-helix domain-containing protein [Chthoniobacterales bacterium]|nr:helix-turn-helix domain-containing protein [Chthoniobacterales bacterium]
MEGLGKKLQEARLARGLTLDEAGRMTKIRPAQLQEIENEDFSQFPSLTYAKGFLLIYGKFLDVDVSPYLEAFETSESLTTDGYSYLQEAPEPEPMRPVKVRRRSAPVSSGGGRSSFMPLIIGIIVLVVGFTVMKWFLQMQRLKPRPTPAPGSSPIATATVSDKIIAPHAQPIESTAPPPPTVAPTPTETVAPTTTPSVPAPPAAEPEVRRAEPVHPQDAAQIPTPSPTPKRSPRPPRPTPSPRLSPTATPRPR